MKKISAVLKKDFILQIRNFKELLIAIILSFLIVGIFSFSESSNITIGVESILKDDIGFNEDYDGLIMNLLNENIVIKTEFYDENTLENKLENNNFPVIILQESDGLLVKMNSSNSEAITTYLLLSRYFNNTEEDSFSVDYISNSSKTLIMLVISFAFIFGGASRGASIIYEEKKNGTLNLLYKSGLNSFAIVLSKFIFTLLVMIFILICIGTFGYLTGYLNLFSSFKNIMFLVFILIPMAILGNFIGIISKSIEESRSYQLLLFIPSMFYISIVNSIPQSYQFLLRFHPGIAVTFFYERILNGYFDLNLFFIIILISILMFALNVLLLKRVVEKEN